MVTTTVKISGMVCGMCEAHINDAIRAAFPVKKVRSSRSKGETVILSESAIDRDRFRQTISAAGYIMLSVNEEMAVKKPLFAMFSKQQS